MTDYPFGTVVIATVRGVPRQQAMRVGLRSDLLVHWHTSTLVKDLLHHTTADLADIEVVYTPPRPRMAEPDPVEWQVVAHCEADSTRARWFRSPWDGTVWYSEHRRVCVWDSLIDPEPYRPDDAAVTP